MKKKNDEWGVGERGGGRILISITLKKNIFTDGGGQNKQHVVTKNIAKLDRETEELKHEKITLDTGKLIQQGRQGKGWSQKELATVSYFEYY